MSELYYFRRYLSSRTEGDAIRRLYRWLDELGLDEPSLESLFKLSGSSFQIDDFLLSKAMFKTARRGYLLSKKNKVAALKKNWVNP